MENSVLQRSEARSIGDILSSPAWKSVGGSGMLRQCRAMSLWLEASGGIAESYTRSIKWSNNTLFVEVTSAALRSELQMRTADIAQTINAMAGECVVTKIVLK
jgi:hypothetical protein